MQYFFHPDRIKPYPTAFFRTYHFIFLKAISNFKTIFFYVQPHRIKNKTISRSMVKMSEIISKSFNGTRNITCEPHRTKIEIVPCLYIWKTVQILVRHGLSWFRTKAVKVRFWCSLDRKQS